MRFADIAALLLEATDISHGTEEEERSVEEDDFMRLSLIFVSMLTEITKRRCRSCLASRMSYLPFSMKSLRYSSLIQRNL